MKSKTLTLGPFDYYVANVRLIAGVVLAAEPDHVEYNDAMITTIAAYNLLRNELGIEEPFGTKGRLIIQDLLEIGKVAVSLRITDLVKIRWATKKKRGVYTLDPRFLVRPEQETWQITYKRNQEQYGTDNGSDRAVHQEGEGEQEV